MSKKIFLTGLFLFACALGLSAQQFTRIGVVNIPRLYELAQKGSPAVKELDEMRANLLKEVARMSDELRMLEARKAEAKAKGNEMEVLNLESEILQKQAYQKEFARVKQAQFNAKRDELKQDTSFLQNVIQKIKEVSEIKGYTMIIRSDDPNLLYYNMESDITEDVIKQMGL